MIAEWSETNDRARVQEPEAVHTDIDRLAAEPPPLRHNQSIGLYVLF